MAHRSECSSGIHFYFPRRGRFIENYATGRRNLALSSTRAITKNPLRRLLRPQQSFKGFYIWIAGRCRGVLEAREGFFSLSLSLSISTSSSSSSSCFLPRAPACQLKVLFFSFPPFSFFAGTKNIHFCSFWHTHARTFVRSCWCTCGFFLAQGYANSLRGDRRRCWWCSSNAPRPLF